LEAMRDAGRKTASEATVCSSLVVPQYVKYYEQCWRKADSFFSHSEVPEIPGEPYRSGYRFSYTVKLEVAGLFPNVKL